MTLSHHCCYQTLLRTRHAPESSTPGFILGVRSSCSCDRRMPCSKVFSRVSSSATRDLGLSQTFVAFQRNFPFFLSHDKSTTPLQHRNFQKSETGQARSPTPRRRRLQRRGWLPGLGSILPRRDGRPMSGRHTMRIAVLRRPLPRPSRVSPSCHPVWGGPDGSARALC